VNAWLFAALMALAPPDVAVAPFRVDGSLPPEMGERAAGLLRDRLEWRSGVAIAVGTLPESSARPAAGPPPAVGTLHDALLTGWLQREGRGIVVTVELSSAANGERRGVLVARAFQDRGLDRAIDEVARRLVGGPSPSCRIGIAPLEFDDTGALRAALRLQLATLPDAVPVVVDADVDLDDPGCALDSLGALDAIATGSVRKQAEGVAATLVVTRRDAGGGLRRTMPAEVDASGADVPALAAALRDPLLVACGIDPPSSASDVASAARARAALERGIADEGARSIEKALTDYVEAAGTARACGDRETEALAQNDIGLLLARRDDERPAIEAMERALASWREIGDRRNEAATLRDLADVLHRKQKWAEAEARYESSLRQWMTLDDLREAAFTWEHLGGNHEDRGDAVVARDDYRKGVAMLDAIGQPADAATVRNRLAWLQSTTKDEKVRDPKAAISEISQALAATSPPNPRFWDTLAEAHAAAGDFASAVAAEKQAIALLDEKDDRRTAFTRRKERFESELNAATPK
jgi:tetratricopeptide (TPR) repeat protein